MSYFQKRMRAKRRRTILCFGNLEPRKMLASFSVTTFDDVVDSSDGVLSLREAIVAANTNAEADVVLLQAGVYQMGIVGANEDASATGDFDIHPDNGNALTIRGLGKLTTTISGDGLDRIFQVHAGAEFNLESATLVGGNVIEEEGVGRRGGNIWSVHASLNLTDVEIRDSQLTGLGVGGAVYIAGGNYRFENSSFLNNSAELQGGVLFARGSDGLIVDSIIAENQINRRASAMFFIGGNYEFQRSVVENNHSELASIIRATDATGKMTLMNISDNTSRFGIADFIELDRGSLQLTRSTLDRNEGTVLVAEDADIEIDHARFLRNAGLAVVANDSNVILNDSRLVAQGNGGIFIDGTTGSLEVSDSFFSRNAGTDIVFGGRDVSIANSEFISRPVVPSTRISYGHALRINEVENTQSISVSDTSFDLYSSDLQSSPPISIVTSEGSTSNGEANIVFERVDITQGGIIRVTGKEISFDEVNIDSVRDNQQLVLTADSVSISRTNVNKFMTFVIGAESTVSDSVFENGGGLNFNGATGAVVVADTIVRNSDRGIAAGDATRTGTLHVLRSQIYGNASVAVSGVVSELLIANSVIRDNVIENNNNLSTIAISPTFDGTTAELTISNSVVANNRTAAKAILSNGNGTVNILSSTFVDNVAGGPIAIVEDEGAVSVANSIFWGNSPADTLFSEVDSFSFRNSAVEDSDPDDDMIPFGGAANGNIDDLPAFADRANSDYRIEAGSPTIDAGDDSLLAIDTLDIDEDEDRLEASPDLDLLDRIVGASTDMGAYEFA